MIEAINVSKSFNNHEVLKNISVKFEKGKTNLIIGQSGSGKTVLANLKKDKKRAPANPSNILYNQKTLYYLRNFSSDS